MLRTRFCAVVAAATLAAAGFAPHLAASASNQSGGLTDQQRAALFAIAKDTWKFYGYGKGIDRGTHLPLDNIGIGAAPKRGTYTSPTNIGVYLWSVVAARDLGLIDRHEAETRVSDTLDSIERLDKWQGLLLAWYDTGTGAAIDGPSNRVPPKRRFLSTVDNGWFAMGLIVARQAVPEFQSRLTALLDAMHFEVFYDFGDQTTDITAGQMYGGFYPDPAPAGDNSCPQTAGPACFHYGLLNTETRIAAYIGIGTHAMPGDVWWRTWRTLPRNFDWQGQTPQPVPPHYVTYRDPQSGKQFSVDEAHYNWPVGTGIPFVPSWGGSQFEALMDPLVIPEAAWGPRSFGLNDLRYAQAQIAYATQTLGYPVWGLSPSSTPDDTGGYDAYGARGMASNRNCCPYNESAVTPHATFIAMPFLPQEAFTNIQNLRMLYPGIYGPYGFFDAVNPVTGQVGHRYLVLDVSMIMAGLDDVLGPGLQSYASRDPIIKAVQPYLAIEKFSIH